MKGPEVGDLAHRMLSGGEDEISAAAAEQEEDHPADVHELVADPGLEPVTTKRCSACVSGSK